MISGSSPSLTDILMALYLSSGESQFSYEDTLQLTRGRVWREGKGKESMLIYTSCWFLVKVKDLSILENIVFPGFRCQQGPTFMTLYISLVFF